MKRVIVLLILLLVPLTFRAVAAELPTPVVPAATETAPVETESPDIPLPDGEPTDHELLVSINTYLTYLFAFGAVFVVVLFGKLIYQFFNMFF